MAAPDLPTLLDFEGNFETAAQAVLATAGITGYVSQQAVKLPLISTGIFADLGPALDELTELAVPSTWPAGTPPPQEYYRFTINLELRVEVPRDGNTPTPAPDVTTLLRTIRGQIRGAFLRVLFPFNDVNLPYYRVSDIKPSGTVTGFEAVRNIDFCSLRFTVTFAIQPGAWPQWLP